MGSVLFYGICGGWPALGFMVLTALVTWLGSIALGKLDAQGASARKATKDRAQKKEIKRRTASRKRKVLVICLLICLGMLGYLKYWNTILYNMGLAESTQSLGILLPLGISFYLFASLGYLIDVYNGRYAAEKNFARFFLFVSWFPQITQGPINRFGEISSQLFAVNHPEWDGMRKGLLRFGYGLLKKYAIANVLVGNLQAILSALSDKTGGFVIILGVFIYSIQLYADFSGGIDMVEGISELFGIQMAQNFRQPYFSVSLADFWRRWHMSLGEWMRTYVFYPLAVTKPLRSLGKHTTKVLGKHVGRTISACIANVVVFVIVGLWHGAEWHYLVWGLYNGVIIALADLLAPVFECLSKRLHLQQGATAYRVLSILRTFVVVTIGRYFDCITDVSLAFTSLWNSVAHVSISGNSAQLASYGVTNVETWGFPPIAIIACVGVFVVSFLYERGVDVRSELLKKSVPFRMAIYLVAGVLFAFSVEYSVTQGEVFLYAFF